VFAPLAITSFALITGAEELSGIATIAADAAGGGGRSGSVSLATEFYLSPVVDDDAPRALQPYIQRATRGAFMPPPA
jgi:hypothetical protein